MERIEKAIITFFRETDNIFWAEQKFFNQTQFGNFDNLHKKWNNCSEIDAYEALNRVFVETISENLLINTVENRLAILGDGEPKTIIIELADLSLDKIHSNCLDLIDLWWLKWKFTD